VSAAGDRQEQCGRGRSPSACEGLQASGRLVPSTTLRYHDASMVTERDTGRQQRQRGRVQPSAALGIARLGHRDSSRMKNPCSVCKKLPRTPVSKTAKIYVLNGILKNRGMVRNKTGEEGPTDE
jgi:hypothetical protein